MRTVAFLRAINVGRAVITMTDLAHAFERAGCSNVRTVIASGNVLFDAPGRADGELAARIGRELRARLGHEPGLMIRTPAELEAAMRASPFDERLEGDETATLYVAFLARAVRDPLTTPLDIPKEALTVLAMTTREVFVVSRPKLNGRSGYPNALVEEMLDVPATTRNWNTVRKIAALLEGERSAASTARARPRTTKQ